MTKRAQACNGAMTLCALVAVRLDALWCAAKTPWCPADGAHEVPKASLHISRKGFIEVHKEAK